MDLVTELRALHHIRSSGMLGLDPPPTAFKVVRAIRRYGNLGGAVAVAAVKHGDRTGLIDELGSLSFAELEARSDALAVALRARGIDESTGVGILCRNHRYLLDGTFAACKVGARTLYLNTDFGAPQLHDVCEREGVSLLIHDEEFSELAAPIEATRLTEDEIQELIDSHAGAVPPAPREPSTVVLLTTGTPKGAPRHLGHTLSPLGALLSKVPYRSREATYVAAPMFHGLGFTQMVLAVMLGSTTITQRRFNPERVLEAVAG